MSTSAIETFNNLGLATNSSDVGNSQKQTLGPRAVSEIVDHTDDTSGSDETHGQWRIFGSDGPVQHRLRYSRLAGLLQGICRHPSAPIRRLQASRDWSAVTYRHQAKEPCSAAGGQRLPAISKCLSVRPMSWSKSSTQTGEPSAISNSGTEAVWHKADFEWNGKDNNGQMANPGVYKIQAEAYFDGKNTVLPTNIKSLKLKASP
jgi:flagellar basal-body rod modification protein FlgD